MPDTYFTVETSADREWFVPTKFARGPWDAGATHGGPPTARPDVTTVWMETIAVLPDEEPSPFQRICPLADCGNAFSRHAEPDRVQFINADLTVALHRDPVGTWMGSRVWSHNHTSPPNVKRRGPRMLRSCRPPPTFSPPPSARSWALSTSSPSRT